MPDLETPGIMASACPSPIKKLLNKLCLFKVKIALLGLSAKSINKATKIEANAIDKLDLRNEFVKLGKKTLIKKPNTNIDKVPIERDFNINIV